MGAGREYNFDPLHGQNISFKQRLIRDQTRNSVKAFLRAPAAAEVNENNGQVPLQVCSGEASIFLTWSRIGWGGLWWRVGVWPRARTCPQACPLLCGAVCRGQAQHLVFASGCLVLVGLFWSFRLFVQNLPQLHMHVVILVLWILDFRIFLNQKIRFLCILQLKEMFVQVQALEHCRKGFHIPGLSHTESLNQRQKSKKRELSSSSMATDSLRNMSCQLCLEAIELMLINIMFYINKILNLCHALQKIF